jgi:predicted transcriptional regulator
MRELIGRITSNPNKIKVLEIIKRAEVDEKTISKFTRVPEKVLRKVIEELKSDGIIEEKNEELCLTELGHKILAGVKGI